MSRAEPLPDRGVTLTRKGWVAILVAQAEPYDWTRKAGDEPGVCRVTVYPPAHVVQERGERTYQARTCGQPTIRYGLCAHHASERERLGSDA